MYWGQFLVIVCLMVFLGVLYSASIFDISMITKLYGQNKYYLKYVLTHHRNLHYTWLSEFFHRVEKQQLSQTHFLPCPGQKMSYFSGINIDSLPVSPPY
jgi:hypothetical protein